MRNILKSANNSASSPAIEAKPDATMTNRKDHTQYGSRDKTGIAYRRSAIAVEVAISGYYRRRRWILLLSSPATVVFVPRISRGGHARHGFGTRALEEFERMKKDGFRPDQVTFINMLSACGHGEFVEEGERQLSPWRRNWDTSRDGTLCVHGGSIWADSMGCVAGSCGLHSSLELGLFAVRGMYNLEQDHPAVYSMLSKIHGDMGVWGNATGLRKG
ncbi:hypothetical protein HHK36_010547 [Tetracentron sinense]|uniref:Uncharacterized protein n=1 Tax=Tetracentron sinense TaxID=13715 RepID=A0A835DGF4_TETSI|nr:hypothetical protein HHK36_010547 [Tetracentron sinense]